MPGLYSHTTRAAGTVVTATIYNGDHQNHIDNQTPDKTDDWSSSATQKQTTSDPYGAQATDTLATSLSEELQQLRYIVGQLGSFLNGGSGIAAATTALGTVLPQWYYGIRNPAFKAVGAHVYSSAAFAYTTAGFKVVTMDTERYDQDGLGTGFHSTAVNTSRLTIPANLGGKYHIGATLQWASNANAAQRQAQILLNGTTVLAQVGQSVSVTSTYDQTLSVDYALIATDYVELAVSAGANMNVTGPNSVAGPEFWCHLIGS